jgi:hypothetical protein
MGTETPETITRAELAEALDHELDSCWVGGRELVVCVWAYVAAHRPVAAPLTLPPDEFAALRSVAATLGWLPAGAERGRIVLEPPGEAGPGTDPPEVSPAGDVSARERPGAVPALPVGAGSEDVPAVLCPTCLHDGVLYRALERAEAAERLLAAIKTWCKDSIGRYMAGDPGGMGARFPDDVQVSATGILAIISGKEGDDHG